MIEALGLSKTYVSGGRPLTVLDGVDLTVAPRELLSIVGPSGSGKTTLLALLAGLDRPTTGTVRLDGTDLADLTEDERAVFRAEKVGFVFQTFHLLPTLTAIENVLVPLELRGLRRTTSGVPIRRRAEALLERVGLGERTHHYPPQLSGGEQQRVAIARAFVNDPRILFADEPTGNLDGETGARIIDLLLEVNRDVGSTVVLVTHDTALAERTDRIVRLARGRVVEDETGGGHAGGGAPGTTGGRGPGRA